ncbi:AmmeMemoRadiSam system protein A [Nitrosophilus kaiyonis]|uniref:AmmeMemoRadiSam system protein A n=1 Tax=Nitrosophilus kaiyonis TaxID=2930200 RepID=UPI002490B9CA|nr:AmmeMemoRadiSam system protein A [Nitrosophilus kaiyonis]
MEENLKRTLLNIARIAIKEEFIGHKELNEDVKKRLIDMFPELKKPGAVFVTINERSSLRGCIGSLVAYRPLIDDVIENAKAAAFSDPRFPPLAPDEFDKISIEISVLSEPKPLEYKDIQDLKSKIRPNIDGVVLKLDGYQATFLPQVWEELSDFDQFFAHLCLKAGLRPNCLELHPEIFTYQVEKFSEEDFK